MRLIGWQTVFAAPPGPKALVIFYPHTSNWDFVMGVLARATMPLRIEFLAKDALFRGPLGPLFRWLGGIPVDRSKPNGVVGAAAERFAHSDSLYLLVTPEGTRKYVDHWRSGFYHMALQAQVPLGLGFIDSATRRIGICGYLTLSGDQDTDLAAIAQAYAGLRGIRHGKEGRIAFRT